MLMKELIHDILINSQNAYGLHAGFVLEWVVQRKKSNYKVMANQNKAGNTGKHNQITILVIRLLSNSIVCNYNFKCFAFKVV